MNNKQLFEQSAGKILSRNQLECVMRLHNTLFEGVNPEQLADTVADAVKDAVDDSLDAVADQQVSDEVSEVSSITVSPEDQIRLESLLGSMSDNERAAFFESLDEQQVQILTEGLGSAAKTFLNFFSKGGRKKNRFNRYSRLAEKDAALTSQLDRFTNHNYISSKTARKLDKLMSKRDKVRQKMNDVKLKASKDPDEFKALESEALKKGSRNLKTETMVAERTRLLNEKDKASKALDTHMQELTDKKNHLETLKTQNPQDKEAIQLAEKEVRKAEKKAKTAKSNVDAINEHIDDMDNRINMSRQDAENFTYGSNRPRVNHANVGGAAAADVANGAHTVINGQVNNPSAYPYAYPYMWGNLTRRFSAMGKISTALIGSWHAFKAALGLGTIGAMGYGGYKLYDFFTKPNELDLDIGDGDGRIPDNVQTVIGLLAGGIGGRCVAKFLGFDSRTGKTVATLLGAVLVAYFMFLNNGDEENAQEMLAEYNNASSTEQKAIEEALNFDGLAAELEQLYRENAAL